MPSRRRFLAATAAGIGQTAFGPLARAQAGARSVRIVVGFVPGGATDVIARILGDKLRGRYAPAVIVDNRAGANGRIAVEHVKSSAPDGATLLFTPDFPLTIIPHLYKKLGYDPLRDLAPVAMCGVNTLVLSGGPGLPPEVKTVADYVQWCKGDPKRAVYAVPSAGSSPHFAGVMLARAAGIELTYVSYKGGAQAIQDLLGGQVPAAINPLAEILPHAKAGRVRVLATTAPARSRFLPDVPTMIESGFKDVVVQGWSGVFAPAKTPPDIVAALHAAIDDALKSSEIGESFDRFGVEIASAAPAQFAATLKADYERWGPIVKASGFSVEE